jgi:type III restriction enzyme
MEILLKDFQKTVLRKFGEFLGAVQILGDSERAFALRAEPFQGHVAPYRAIEGIESVPFSCVRLPTGGGKTVVAAHAIREATGYLERDFPFVLWLTPTDTIRTQTADALKKPGHPYRKALDDAFDGKVRVFDVTEFRDIRPSDIEGGVVVVVATMQTFRVSSTEGRKVYAHNENLEAHFTPATIKTAGLELIDTGKPGAGKVRFSFANLLRIQRPMVIVDEAHNFSSGLSEEVLRRINPSLILELTATPDTHPKTRSNVLCRVTATELKDEDMVKLPIMLAEQPNGWRSAVRDALARRAALAKLAEDEQPYVRPILLIQAESKDKPANVDAVKAYLLEDERVAPETVAVATGTERGIEGQDLFSRDCPIEVIITVQALREGWDCSFAYVFCSTANISSSTAVEQLLGRVLRMPYAKKRKHIELNRAYAHLVSPSFNAAALQLEDKLTKMGFDRGETERLVEKAPEQVGLSLLLSKRVLPVTQPPALEDLPRRERESVEVVSTEDGGFMLGLRTDFGEDVKQRVLAVVAPDERQAAASIIDEHLEEIRDASPSDRGEELSVPGLSVLVDGQLEMFDKDIVTESFPWKLSDHPANVDGYKFDEHSNLFEVDIRGYTVTTRFAREEQLGLGLLAEGWTVVDVVRWLDRQLRDERTSSEELQTWLHVAVTALVDKRKVPLSVLIAGKFLLARRLGESLAEARQEAYDDGYQMLFAQATVETRDEFFFRYPVGYPDAGWLYKGTSWKFEKHFYSLPGELNASGDEFECAKALDSQSGLRYWVRNISRGKNSFWLQTSTDKFYPDFTAELLDGRKLVVEYKGEAYETNDDSREKCELGELWEKRSEGRCLFLLVVKRDELGREPYEQIKAKIEA